MYSDSPNQVGDNFVQAEIIITQDELDKINQEGYIPKVEKTGLVLEVPKNLKDQQTVEQLKDDIRTASSVDDLKVIVEKILESK